MPYTPVSQHIAGAPPQLIEETNYPEGPERNPHISHTVSDTTPSASTRFFGDSGEGELRPVVEDHACWLRKDVFFASVIPTYKSIFPGLDTHRLELGRSWGVAKF